jgi:L-glutamine-phosphate cytidylyltransferase
MPLTDETPKCYAEVGGRRIVDWAIDALRAAGLREIVFVGGYQIDRIRADYPSLSFRHNDDWPNNNILASLFYAEDAMADGFVCSYADILYRPAIVARLLASPADVALAVDTDWRRRYADRTQHPEDDAEKVRVDGDRIVQIGREIAAEEADGEFIGVARFSPTGARLLREQYARALAEQNGRPFRGAPSLQKAYLIHMLQELLDRGVEIAGVETAGEYFEVDTTEDYHLANEVWR